MTAESFPVLHVLYVSVSVATCFCTAAKAPIALKITVFKGYPKLGSIFIYQLQFSPLFRELNERKSLCWAITTVDRREYMIIYDI